MAYVISDECVACGTCAEECPAEAISEGDGKYVIDADTCLECGTCERQGFGKSSLARRSFCVQAYCLQSKALRCGL